MKQINEYTTDELSAKIEAIKAERERMANALKRHEEELERRKQEVPLGVPIINVSPHKTLYWLNGAGIPWEEKTNLSSDVQLRQWSFLNVFHSKESAEKHAEMLREWRQYGLVANAKGEPISINVLRPLLSKGNVCCTYSGKWFYSEDKITLAKDIDCWIFSGTYTDLSSAFNIKPALDWRNSLMECGL